MALVDVLNQWVAGHTHWLALSPVEPLPRQRSSLASRRALQLKSSFFILHFIQWDVHWHHYLTWLVTAANCDVIVPVRDICAG